MQSSNSSCEAINYSKQQLSQLNMCWNRAYQHVCSRHRDHQSQFRCTAAGTQCAAFVDARRLADADPCTCHHKAWFLLLGAGWCLWIAVTTASVRVKCRRLTCVLYEEIRTHNSTSPRTSLAESSGENPVPVVCHSIPVPAWNRSCIPCGAARAWNSFHPVFSPRRRWHPSVYI